MRHGSLFSGIGGFDQAAEWMGWENVFHCEWNQYCKAVLKELWPNSISFNDITKTDFTIFRGRIDVLTGGFPCQPYSTAGKRLGKDDERHLWPEMLRAIREIAPPWVVGENVRGLVNWNAGLVFEEVQTDLEAQGYEVQPFLLPAAGVDAPHERYRIWFVASNLSNSGIEDLRKREINADQFVNASNSNGERHEEHDTSSITSESKRFYCKKNIGIQHIGWRNFPTQSPICIRDDGFSDESLRQFIQENCHGLLSEKEIDEIISKSNSKWREEVIKAGGNAIVPQVALQIFKAIEAYHKAA